MWFTQQCANQHIRATRLADNCAAIMIKIIAPDLHTLSQRTSAQIRATGEHEAGRFTASMGINKG